MSICPARADYAVGNYLSVHDCDDPVACALSVEPNDQADELRRLHEVLDEIEDLTHGRKTLRSEVVLKLIHDERGGPR